MRSPEDLVRSSSRLAFASLCATGALMAAPAPKNVDESKVPPYTLPDPLLAENGKGIRNAETWRAQRRPELLELFSREVYGRTPGGRPETMHWKVTSVERAALGGKAVRKEVTLWFTEKTDGPQMHLLIYQPSAVALPPRPWPVFLGLNFYGNHTINSDPGITLSQAWMRANESFKIVNNRATEGSRGVQASRWEVESVVARGYATATAYYGDLCPDNPDGPAQGVGTLFPARPGASAGDTWGAIGMWAWGLSRAMDVLERDPEIDGKRVAVHGHSRLGKTALWAAAQDERFAMAISNCSGAGGAALGKRIFGETVALGRNMFPYWYAKNYARYDDNEAALPIDQHELLALIAPRPLYVASATLDTWADPLGEFLSLKHAEPVYRLFGKKGLGIAKLPAPDSPIHGDPLGYHLRTGAHNITAYDWAQYLDFADRHLKPKP